MESRTNVLLITADDMNGDAVGAFGCPVPDTTPNLDRLAAAGVCFRHAHVNIAVCQPSRYALMTGRHPHRSGGEGFFRLRKPGVPILPDILREANYRVGILGKVAHSTPYETFRWDMVHDMPELGHGRNPAVYGTHAARFMRDAVAAGKPFFLMANSHDPHRPFFGNDPDKWYEAAEQPHAARPSRVFAPEEALTPGFLPDLPEVRREIAEYYSSVRRCDDTVGAVLAALEDSGAADNTIVVFLSDNGMAFPFAKTNCYLNSTRTPWIVRWPGGATSNTQDVAHMISGIDLLPTLLEALDIPAPDGMDGASFLPALQGHTQPNRDLVFTGFHQTAGRRNYPMRCVQSRRFGYILNPWSNGERVFLNESQSGRTFEAMRKAAPDSPEIAARVNLFLHRVTEEFYDFAADPDALRNLAGAPEVAAEQRHLMQALEEWMRRTDDPALEALRHRYDPERLEACTREAAERLGGD